MWSKRKRSFTAFNIVTTVIEEVLIVVFLAVVLPAIGVSVPLYIIAIAAAAWAGWSYLTYRIGLRAVQKAPATGAEALIGARCRTLVPLAPVGYVKVRNEQWQAHSIAGEIESGIEVVIIEVKGLTLMVKPYLEATDRDLRDNL